MRASRLLVPLVVCAAAATGCGAGGPAPASPSSGRGPSGPSSSAVAGSSSASPTASRTTTAPTPSSRPTASSPPADRAATVLAGMDPRERAGQLVMTGYRFGNDPSATEDALRAGAGNLFLGGRTSNGTAAVAGVSARFQALAPTGVPLLVATDQEGGQVQVMSGPGFETIPSAVLQGGWDPAALQAAATRWGTQLAAGGVRVDLGPVLDTVPTGADNPPIGGYARQFGADPATVAAHGVAVARGLAAAGVVATAKHFPGLGRVSRNTDTSTGVVDPTTGPDDPYLQPFRDAVAAGVPMMMVSSAIYPRIDGREIAAFSPAVVTDLLRRDLGFRGVVISDDLGNATAVADVPVGDRATRLVAAGGDLVLSVAPSQAGTMIDAIVARAQADPAFARQVDAAALRVLRLKQAIGLLR